MFRCKEAEGVIRSVSSLFINNAFLPAAAVCNYKLFYNKGPILGMVGPPDEIEDNPIVVDLRPIAEFVLNTTGPYYPNSIISLLDVSINTPHIHQWKLSVNSGIYVEFSTIENPSLDLSDLPDGLASLAGGEVIGIRVTVTNIYGTDTETKEALFTVETL